MANGLALAQEWLALDLNPTTRARVQGLFDLAGGAGEEELRGLLGTPRLVFGTAGLRGPMGVGYGRMNDVVVRQAAQGLCQWAVLKFGQDQLQAKGVVIGFDHRRSSEFGVSSQRMAHTTAAVFLSRGAKVQLYSKQVATPLVPFQLLATNALCGVMVTASHNPKDDDGYKVYGSNGAQICMPVDDEISASIMANLSPWDGVASLINQDSGELTSLATAQVEDPFASATAVYFKEIAAALCSSKVKNAESSLRFVYTAMHGVGHPFTSQMIQEFGFTEGKHFFAVEEQRDADPDFPTVSFPNPEEKGALNLGIQQAKAIAAEYVIANDPDADRFTAAQRSADGEYVQFTGDELGVLFADWAIYMARAAGADVSKGLLVNSAVSSGMLDAVAKHHGCVYSDALTGFKWLANCAASLCEEKNLNLFLAYEEAIGYQLSPLVRDKDGISASAVFCEMASHRAAEGSSVRGRLDAISEEVGHFATCNGYFICRDPAVMATIFNAFREGTTKDGTAPTENGFPDTVGGLKLLSVRDVTRGMDTAKKDLASHLPATPKDQMLTLFFEQNTRITLRGSGTEPKLKYYTEASAHTREAAQSRADLIAELVCEAVLQPDLHGLTRPSAL